MNRCVKNGLIFIGGAMVGTAITGTVVIAGVVTSKTLRPYVVDAISNKIANDLGYEVKPKRSYVSYQNYRRPVYYTDDIRDILFASYAEAEKIIKEAADLVDKYGFVSVADIYVLCDLPSSYKSAKYGWSNTDSFRVVQKSDGRYYIAAPPVTKID